MTKTAREIAEDVLDELTEYDDDWTYEALTPEEKAAIRAAGGAQ